MHALAHSTLSRRAAVRLGGGAAAALAALAAAPAAAQDEPAGTPEVAPPATATIVLVHGAWAGSWIWRKIIPLLRAAGHDVYAGTATGMGDRAHLARPDIGLDTYVTDVVNLLEFEDLTNVMLVGWSYGGMTITGVAERVPERLRRVVYLDAALPADGQSFNDLLPVTKEAVGAPGYFPVWTDFVTAMTKDPADLAWLLSKFVPQPLPTLTQPLAVGNPAAAALPRAFIACTENPMEPFASAATRLREDAGWRVLDLADNHFAAINSPQETADALLSLA